MNKLFVCAVVFALTSTACRTAQPLPEGMHVGGSVQAQQRVRFAVVDAEPAKFFDKSLLVEASVVAVCQNRGCWMQIEDDGRKAMVRWESGCGGQYAFPKDAAGKRVLIQGSFYPQKFSDEAIEHMQGETDRAIAIPREGYEFNASAVIVLDA